MSECEANWSGMLRHAIFEVRGTAAFHAFALNHDFELVGAQRVPGSERCAGVVAVAAPNVVERDPLFFVAYGVPSRLGLRRGAVPVAFRDGVGGFGLALFNGAGGRSRRCASRSRHPPGPPSAHSMRDEGHAELVSRVRAKVRGTYGASRTLFVLRRMDAHVNEARDAHRARARMVPVHGPDILAVGQDGRARHLRVHRGGIQLRQDPLGVGLHEPCRVRGD